MVQFIIENKAILFGALFAVSEALALVPSIKANSVFQAFFNGLQLVKEKLIK